MSAIADRPARPEAAENRFHRKSCAMEVGRRRCRLSRMVQALVEDMNRSRPAPLSRARPCLPGRTVAVSALFAARRGFTILELLVVISIVTILTAVLMPTLAKVREAGERVQCASNMRQVACALIDYTDENRDRLPTLNYTSAQSIAPRFGEAMALSDDTGRVPDGLGRLILGKNGGYLSDPRVLYCPCHRGDHPFSRYETQLMQPIPFGQGETVFCNYHYRGTVDPVTLEPMPRSVRPDTVLLVDGLRTRSDFSHVTGTNRLKADASVDWRADTLNRIYNALPSNIDGVTDPEVFSTVWQLIDNRPAPTDD